MTVASQEASAMARAKNKKVELFPTEECLKKMRVNKRNKIKRQAKYPEGQGSDSLRYQPITYKSRQKLCNFTYRWFRFRRLKKLSSSVLLSVSKYLYFCEQCKTWHTSTIKVRFQNHLFSLHWFNSSQYVKKAKLNTLQKHTEQLWILGVTSHNLVKIL